MSRDDDTRGPANIHRTTIPQIAHRSRRRLRAVGSATTLAALALFPRVLYVPGIHVTRAPGSVSLSLSIRIHTLSARGRAYKYKVFLRQRASVMWTQHSAARHHEPRSVAVIVRLSPRMCTRVLDALCAKWRLYVCTCVWIFTGLYARSSGSPVCLVRLCMFLRDSVEVPPPPPPPMPRLYGPI